MSVCKSLWLSYTQSLASILASLPTEKLMFYLALLAY